MRHGLVRALLTVVLGVLVAFGMSNLVVASGTMSVAMTQADAMSLSMSMPATDCPGDTEPCGGETAGCTLACGGPGLALPSAPESGRRLAVLRGAAASAASSAPGRTPPPGLPPPRLRGTV